MASRNIKNKFPFSVAKADFYLITPQAPNSGIFILLKMTFSKAPANYHTAFPVERTLLCSVESHD